MNGGQWVIVIVACTLIICLTVDNVVSNVLKARRGEEPRTVVQIEDKEQPE